MSNWSCTEGELGKPLNTSNKSVWDRAVGLDAINQSSAPLGIIKTRNDALNYVNEFSLFYDGSWGDDYFVGPDLRIKTKPVAPKCIKPYYKVMYDGEVFFSTCTNRLTNLLWGYAEGLYGECPDVPLP